MNTNRTQVRSGWTSSIERELRLRIQEGKDFLLGELEHVRIMCKALAQSEYKDPLIVYGETWAESVKEYLNNYFERSEGYLTSGEFDELRRLTSWLTLTATLMQNYTIESVSRKKRVPKLAGNALILSYPLGEVHPAFAEAIRSIETINCWLHNESSVFLGRFQSIPPILAVSAFEQYAFQIFPMIPLWEVPRAQRKSRAEWFLCMSWITLPRWTPAHIRFCPAVAHEHFHRIGHLVRAAFIEQAQERKTLQANEETIRSRLEDFYGSGLMFLLDAHSGIFRSLFVLFSKLPKDCLTQLFNTQGRYFVQLTAPAFEEVTLRSADLCAEEFLADIYALIMLGPSYLWSFLNEPTMWFTSCIESLGFPGVHHTHPPPCMRLEVMLRVLRETGCHQILTEAEHEISDLRSKFPQVDPRGHWGFQVFSTWLDDNIERFLVVCRRLSEMLKVSCWTKIQKDGETAWMEQLKDVWSRLKEGHVYLEESVTVDTIINALWWKELYVGQEEMLGHLAWRLALSSKLQTVVR